MLSDNHPKSFVKFVVSFLFLLLVLSCNSDTTEGINPASVSKFDPVIADREFEGKSTEKSWNYLLEVLNLRYSNT